jgi:hypothetical protein
MKERERREHGPSSNRWSQWSLANRPPDSTPVLRLVNSIDHWCVVTIIISLVTTTSGGDVRK